MLKAGEGGPTERHGDIGGQQRKVGRAGGRSQGGDCQEEQGDHAVACLV